MRGRISEYYELETPLSGKVEIDILICRAGANSKTSMFGILC